jgi:DNA-binding GntR family transcriptional regulator
LLSIAAMTDAPDAPAELDPQSSVPPYKQIASWLRVRIAAGKYGPRDPLPSRQELRETFGVANATAGAAIRQLVSEGLVVSRQGSAVFVRPVVADNLDREREIRAIRALIAEALTRLDTVTGGGSR